MTREEALAVVERLREQKVVFFEDGGKLRYKAPQGLLTAEQKAELKEHAAVILAAVMVPPPSAAAAADLDPVETVEVTPDPAKLLDALLAAEAEADERRARELVERRAREHAEEQERARRDVMATWPEAKVRELVAVGKLTSEDVRTWHAAKGALERRAVMATAAGILTNELGRVVKLVEGPNGATTVAVGPVSGWRKSTFQGGYGKGE